MADLKPRSHDVTTGIQKAPARAMLRAVGMTDDDWGKTQVGVASSWNEVTPCNLPLDRLESFQLDYPKKNLHLKARGGRTWNFTTKAPTADSLYAFERQVTAALVRLTKPHATPEP